MTCSISFTSGFFFWLPAIVLFSFVQRNTFLGFVIFVLCNPKIQSLRTCGGHPTAAAAACRTNLQAQFAEDLIWKSIQLCSFQVCLTSDWNWNNTFRWEKSCVTHIKIAFPVQNSSPEYCVKANPDTDNARRHKSAEHPQEKITVPLLLSLIFLNSKPRLLTS